MPGRMLRNKAIHFWSGLALFIVGGVILAVWGETAGTAVGTTVGLAGLVLLGWAWVDRNAGEG